MWTDFNIHFNIGLQTIEYTNLYLPDESVYTVTIRKK